MHAIVMGLGPMSLFSVLDTTVNCHAICSELRVDLEVKSDRYKMLSQAILLDHA